MMESGRRPTFRRLWHALPIDGRGILAPSEPDARYLIALATNRRLASVPPIIRAIAVWISRMLWCVRAATLAASGSRKFGFSFRETLGQYVDACLYGLHPKDAFAWRRSMSALPPLSTQALWKIAVALAPSGARAVLADKLATAAALQNLPVTMPKLLAVIEAGTVAPSLPDCDRFFVKPRFGRRGRNAFSVTRRGVGTYWMEGALRDAQDVVTKLRTAAAREPLLVQQRVEGIPELADLGSPEGASPVLRIMTACEPGGEPYLHGALLSMPVAGEVSSHPLRSMLRAPVAIADGRLLAGFWLGAPGTRYKWSPWHEAQVEGRLLPGFQAAVSAAINAASAFRDLPFIGWDIILSPSGPVVLEGNCAVNLLVLTWMDEGAPDAKPLLKLMRSWADEDRTVPVSASDIALFR